MGLIFNLLNFMGEDGRLKFFLIQLFVTLATIAACIIAFTAMGGLKHFELNIPLVIITVIFSIYCLIVSLASIARRVGDIGWSRVTYFVTVILIFIALGFIGNMYANDLYVQAGISASSLIPYLLILFWPGQARYSPAPADTNNKAARKRANIQVESKGTASFVQKYALAQPLEEGELKQLKELKTQFPEIVRIFVPNSLDSISITIAANHKASLKKIKRELTLMGLLIIEE